MHAVPSTDSEGDNALAPEDRVDVVAESSEEGAYTPLPQTRARIADLIRQSLDGDGDEDCHRVSRACEIEWDERDEAVDLDMDGGEGNGTDVDV